MRAVASILIIVVSSAVAHADSTAALPRGMQLAVEDGGLYVERGALKAPWPTGSRQRVEGVDGLVVDAATGKVGFDVELCNPTVHVDTTLDALEARLANALGLAMHRKKQYAKAALAFRKAVALDPSFDLAAENLASALALGGEPDPAAQALAPWIASNPTWVYARVATDPELASLRGHRAITALRAPARGDVAIKDGALVGGVAWSAARGEVAAVHVEASWGSCSWFADVQIFDVKTRALRATLPLVEWTETNPDCDGGSPGVVPASMKAVRARGAVIQRLLRELGFTSAGVVDGETGVRDGDALTIARFPAAKLAFELDDAKPPAPMSFADASGTISRPAAAWWVPGARLIVDEWRTSGSEGCDWTDPTGIDLVAVP